MSDGGFYKLPTEIAGRCDLTVTAKVVFAVATDLDRRGMPASILKLQSRCGLSKHAVIRARRELQDKGLIGSAESALPPSAESALPKAAASAESALGGSAESALKVVPKAHYITEIQSNNTENNLAVAGATPQAEKQSSLLPEDQRKPARTPKHNTDPRVKTFVDWFCLEYERQAGRKYIVQGGKDGKLVKGLLASVALEDLQRAARNMLTDPFWRNQADISTLSSKLNRFTGGNPNGNGHSASEQGPARKTGGYQTAIEAQRAADATKCGNRPRIKVIRIESDDGRGDQQVAAS